MSAALLVAGCGGGGSDAAGESQSSPLEAIFGGNQSEAEMRAQQLAQEESVANCMIDLGWEYTPVDWAAQFDTSVGSEDAELSTEEYGKKYAYGFVRNYELYELPYLLDPEGQNEETDSTVPEDPNWEYQMSLSTEEQEQYQADLYGDPSIWEMPESDGTEDTVFTSPPLEDQGCQGQAQLEVYGEQPWNNPDFNVLMEELNQDIENDPAITSAERAWSQCMTEELPDVEIADPDSTWMYLESRKAEFSGQEVVETEFDPQTGEPLDSSFSMEDVYTTSSNADGTGYAIMGQPEPMSEADIERLREIEVELWDADQKCIEDADLKELRMEAEQKMADAILEQFPEFGTANED